MKRERKRVCFYRWFVQPTHLCVAHSELHNVLEVFNSFHVVHVVWCGVVWWDGGERILVSGARVVDEVSEGGEVIGIEGSHSLGEKAVEQSGRAGSDALPDSDAAGQHTLNCSPVECGEDGWRETCSFKLAQEVEPLLRLLG